MENESFRARLRTNDEGSFRKKEKRKEKRKRKKTGKMEGIKERKEEK